jgi:predicted dehydrogenase
MLNVAIIGCGWVADWHAADLLQLPERFGVGACCDVDEAKRAAFAARHGVPKQYARLDDVLAQRDIDCVVVCTPPATHHAMVIASLRAGKHVVCEKPFASSLEQVDEIIALQARSKARCMPVFQYRFGDGVARVRHVIVSGLAGRHFVSSAETAKKRGPDYYAVAWRGKFATELGGVLLTQAIHIHDLLLWLIGAPAEVACFKTTRVNPIEVEDCAVASLRMTDGSLASLTATLGSARQVTRLRLCFENVTFEKQCYDDDSARPGNEPWTIIPRDAEIGRAIEAKAAEIASQRSWFVRQYELFDEALENDTPFPVTLDDARRSIELITAMFESDEAGTIVRLPIKAGHPKYGGWVPDRPASPSQAHPAVRAAGAPMER